MWQHRSTDWQLVVEKKGETSTMCRRTCEARASGGRSSGGSLGSKRRKEKGALGKGTSLSPGLWSHQRVARPFGALAGFVPGDPPSARGEARRGIVRSGGLKRGLGGEEGAQGKGASPRPRCRHLWCPGRRCAG
ncbi:uncharacterized protein LOC113483872 [Athene cunicularia]|uniref:uncharacterized protein LOC113483872 n=1 Tax=Athene cunicularia TaxID=194338 RepID=UPI000EF6A75E|nr:uncharacterized protein LOC113483872 [Athene cunicularia]